MAKEPIRDATLGEVKWNEEYRWWEARLAVAPGREVTVSVETDDDDEPREMPEGARRVYSRLRDDEQSFRRAAAERLLSLYNDTWSEGERIDAGEFMNRIRLDGATAYADGSAEVYYQDGELFAGHSILLSVGAGGEVENADLAG